MPSSLASHGRVQRLGLSAFLLLLSLQLGPARAELPGVWTPFGPPTGRIAQILPDPVASTTVYAVTAANGSGARVFKSGDQGRHWTFSGYGLSQDIYVETIAADPRVRGTLYAASVAAVYRSTNAGARWFRISDASYRPLPLANRPPLRLAAVADGPAGSPASLLCACRDALLRSADGGRSWAPVLREVPVDFLTTDGNKAGAAVYAGSRSGELRRSLDGGRTWRLVWTAPPGGSGGRLVALAAAPRNPASLTLLTERELYQSRDRGESWQTVAAPPRDPLGTFAGLALDPGDPRRLQVAETGGTRLGVWSRGSDGIWRISATPLAAPATGLLRLGRGTDLLVTSGFEIAGSRDGGATWERRITLSGTSSNSPLRLRFDRRSGGRPWVLTGGRLYTSDDREREGDWREVPVTIRGRTIVLYDLALAPPGSGTPVGTGSNLLVAGQTPGLLRSADGGATWTFEAAPVSGAGQIARLADGSLLLADQGVVRSRDGGVAWERTLTSTDGLEDGYERYANGLLIGAGPSPTIYLEASVYHRFPAYYDHLERLRSRDGGATWTLLPGATGVLALDPSHPRTLYRLDGAGLAASDDEGDHWSHLAAPLAGVAAVGLWFAPGPPDGFYVVTSGGKVQRTGRDGVTWEPASAGLDLTPFLNYITGDPLLPHQLYAGNFDALFTARFP